MRPEIRGLLDRNGGVVTRDQLVAALPVHVVDHAVRSGTLQRLFPCTYATPSTVDDPAICRRGALRYAGSDAALSHTSGLQAWGMSVADEGRVHLLTDRTCRLRHAAGLVSITAKGSSADHPPYSCATGSTSFDSKAVSSTAGRSCHHSTDARR